MPALSFAVDRAEAVRFAAAPTLAFTLGIAATAPVRSIALDAQIRIAVGRRAYDPATQARLVDVFGEPARWATTLHDLFWARAAVVVGAFDGRTAVEVPVPCTYDFDVAAAKYLHALGDGEIPLALLFSGTVFYLDGEGRLRAERIPWDCEAAFRLPVRTWKAAVEQHFPHSAWLRIDRDVFGRLSAYRARRALATWDDTVDALLRRAEGEAEP
ncbi:MAG TPA: DUF6084 family protein [Candidatus Binatia bacterium]|jgi:hypothetical protein|nr:DUF6084 family protein [Candidatus Binatia bacterium]